MTLIVSIPSHSHRIIPIPTHSQSKASYPFTFPRHLYSFFTSTFVVNKRYIPILSYSISIPTASNNYIYSKPRNVCIVWCIQNKNYQVTSFIIITIYQYLSLVSQLSDSVHTVHCSTVAACCCSKHVTVTLSVNRNGTVYTHQHGIPIFMLLFPFPFLFPFHGNSHSH